MSIEGIEPGKRRARATARVPAPHPLSPRPYKDYGPRQRRDGLVVFVRSGEGEEGRWGPSRSPLLAIFSNVFCIIIPAFALLFALFPLHAFASGVSYGMASASNAPTFQVDAGFQTRYRDGNWVPVRVTLSNNGADFSGSVSVSAIAPAYLGQSNTLSSSSYAAAITLPQGSQKRVTLALPLYYDVQNIVVRLLDSGGNVVRSQTVALNPLQPGDALVGVLSDSAVGFGSLNAVALPNQGGSVALQFLDASTLPSTPALLANFDALVFDNFTSGTLNAAQLSALQSWVQRGGTLILIGGPEWRRTLAPLPVSLLPVTIQGTTTLAAKTTLLPTGSPGTEQIAGKNTGVPSPISISTASVRDINSAVLLASRGMPLIVQAQEGQGRALYLAYDPTLQPLLGWSGIGSLWEGLLLRGVGDRLLAHANSTGGFNVSEQPLLSYRMSTFLQLLLPNALPTPWLALALVFIAFVLVIGPLRYLLVRWTKQRSWSWRIILGSIVIFSLLSYGLAYGQKGASIYSDSITLVQFGQSSSPTQSAQSAHDIPASVTTYLGIFVPNEGTFQAHIDGDGIAQPSPDDLVADSSGLNSPTETAPVVVTPGQSGSDVTLRNAGIWTLHSLISQQNRSLPNGLTSNLVLQNGTIQGTITNHLSYPLNDVLLLLPNAVLKVGNMASGQTKSIQLKPSSAPMVANATLADLIAQDTNSPGFDQLPASKLTTPWLRHLAMMYALDGEGFFGSPSVSVDQCKLPVPILPTTLCFGPAQIGNSSSAGGTNILATAGWPLTTTRTSDPLLAPGTSSGLSATLIGWVENPADTATGLTVNSMHPSGLNETMISAPLPVRLSGTLDLPPTFVQGSLVDVTGKSAQVVLPGIYALGKGSMTFEYLIPTSGLKLSGLTISERSDVAFYASQVGSTIDPGTLPFALYNWHTHGWDIISLFQYSYSSSDTAAYIGPGGRVLVQLANTTGALGTVAFGTPTLNISGHSV